MLAGCETAVRLGGSALKNALAISLALAKNNKQLSGKVNLGRMLRETRDLRTFPMTEVQYRQFAKMAKPQKLLYSVIRDKDGGEIEVVLPVTELERANLIFEKMLYNLPEHKPPEAEVDAVEPQREPGETEVERAEPQEPEQEERRKQEAEQVESPEPEPGHEQKERREPQKAEAEAAQPDNIQPEREPEVKPSKNIQRSPEPAKQDDPKKGSRLASDLNATKPSSSIWKGSGNITRTISERVSIEERLRKFKAQIDAARGLEPTRAKSKNKEQAR